jgi:hypothetical protein
LVRRSRPCRRALEPNFLLFPQQVSGIRAALANMTFRNPVLFAILEVKAKIYGNIYGDIQNTPKGR